MRASIHSLDHYALAVPDLAAAAAFYRSFGLEPRAADGGFDLFTVGGAHRWGRYREGDAKALEYVSFGAYAQDMAALRERIAARGLELAKPPAGAVDDTGVWFRDGDGTLVEVRIAEKSSPDGKLPVGAAGTSAPLRCDATSVAPRRLSHVLLFTSDVARAVEFYCDVLGLGLSDAAGDGIAFLHGLHGSDHHLVAFAKSDARGFHHSSWDVASVNDVGLGAMQMADAGHSRGWGVGRHVLGSNYFHYVRDPWGSYAEYSHDIDFVPAGGGWKPRQVTPDNGFYLWGPQPPEDFAHNYESPTARS